MSHTCKALIIHCIDFRLQKAIKKYLEDQGLLGTCDVVSIAGGVKDANFVMSQIEVSKHLHNIKNVILMNHTDCGAYGGKRAFGSEIDEEAKHNDDMENLKRQISAKYPDLKIETVLARISTTGQVAI